MRTKLLWIGLLLLLACIAAGFMMSSGRVAERQSLYVTEGILRAIHRQISDEPSPYTQPAPYHTLQREDAAALVPGEVTEISFRLYATSVLIGQGHQIRVALAGHDGSAFERYPAGETPLFTGQRHRAAPSSIALPMQER